MPSLHFGRWFEAEEAFRRAIDAGVAEARFHLGALLARQWGREEEAIEAYERAIAAGESEAQIALDVFLTTYRPRKEGSLAASRAVWRPGRIGSKPSGRLAGRRRGASPED